LRAALNLGLNHLRQKRRWNMTSADVLDVDENLLPTSGGADLLVARETSARVRKAALSLSERQREVLLLRIDGALSFAEIGATLEITEGNAKAHFHLAVKGLRELLGTE
jgi:RNA polymerase sigma-70 factor (ECF subfamily)